MIIGSYSSASRAGMTLVELMVVLAILAALMTTVSFSTVGMRDRHRVEKTQQQGVALVEALQRPDGLSLLSDIGRLPSTIDELKWLCQRSILSSEGSTLEVPAYQSYKLWDTTATVGGHKVLRDAVNTTTAFKQMLATQRLGAGWRGPYLSTTIQTLTIDTTTQRPLLRDAFGGDWELVVPSGGDDPTLVSYGRDHLQDSMTSERRNWQDIDLSFNIPKKALTQQVELVVKLTWSGTNPLATATYFYFQPILSTTSPMTLAIDCRYHVEQTNPTAFIISSTCPVTSDGVVASTSSESGLTIGTRACLVIATDTEGNKFASAVHYLSLKIGTQSLPLTLYPLQ